MTRPLLSLVMIVKDECLSMRKVLEAAKPWIDTWTILDTGSTDNTQDLIREAMADMPGQLFEEPFVDYATSRNRVLELHAQGPSPAEFSLMLSGDEFLCDGAKLREYLETQRATNVDCHFLRILIDETTSLSPRVLRTGSAWKYEDGGLKVHEFPANLNPDAPVGTISNVTIEHVVSDHEKRFSNIWENHIPLLKAALEENPDNERALIFLAQSYESLLRMMGPGERITYAMKAMSLYMRRLMIPTGNDAERNYCKMHYLDTARLTGVYNDHEVFERAKELVENDPQRPEVAMLLVHAAARAKVPAVQVYQLAAHAAQVAANAGQIDNSSPVSTSCEWQSHLIAAGLAKQIATKHPDAKLGEVLFTTLVRDHVSAGLAAGGAWETFKSVAAEIVPATSSTTNGVASEASPP